MKCKDCGRELYKPTEGFENRKYPPDINQTNLSSVPLCDPCFEMRKQVMAGKVAEPGSCEFFKILELMSEGKGYAKGYIERIIENNKEETDAKTGSADTAPQE